MKTLKKILIACGLALCLCAVFLLLQFRSKNITSFYNNSPSSISYIVILNGNTGEKKEITDKNDIKEITSYLSAIKMKKVIEPASTGWTYSITVYEDNEKPLNIWFNGDSYCHINGTKYKIENNSNKSITDICKKLY